MSGQSMGRAANTGVFANGEPNQGQEKALHIDIPVKLADVKTVYLKFSEMSAFGDLRKQRTNQSRT
jgi:hypothetical protein